MVALIQFPNLASAAAWGSRYCEFVTDATTHTLTYLPTDRDPALTQFLRGMGANVYTLAVHDLIEVSFTVVASTGTARIEIVSGESTAPVPDRTIYAAREFTNVTTPTTFTLRHVVTTAGPYLFRITSPVETPGSHFTCQWQYTTWRIDKTVAVKPTITTPAALGNVYQGSPVDIPLACTQPAHLDAPVWSYVPSQWADSQIPEGLSVTPDGRIVGTPTKLGGPSEGFAVRATNVLGFGQRTFNLTVIADNRAPTITTTELPALSAGTAVDLQLTATGKQPITWAISGGALPDGMHLADDGRISGAPNYGGDYSVTIDATNTVGTVSKTFSGNVFQPERDWRIETVATLAGWPDRVMILGAGQTPTVAWLPTDRNKTLAVAIPARDGHPATYWIGSIYVDGSITGRPGQPAVITPGYNLAAYGQLWGVTAYIGLDVTTFPLPPIITSPATALGNLEVGQPVSVQLLCEGSATGRTWIGAPTGMANGAPAGLTVSPTGLITGTPTRATDSYRWHIGLDNHYGADDLYLSGAVAPAPAKPKPPTYSIGTRFRDRIVLHLETSASIPGGAGAVQHNVRAAVWPLSAEELISTGRDASTVRYRCAIAWPDVIPAATSAIEWRGTLYQVDGPSLQYTRNGVLTHQELLMKRSTG